ncbi:hypothetical protein DMENIID0001_030960 [Sergentomyia squamirostris]
MSCNIIFEKTDGVYTSGETITGHIEIITSSSKDVHDISLTFIGKVEVKWDETESYTENHESLTRSVTYYNYKEFLHSQIVLFGEEGGPKIKLREGLHTYDFGTILSKALPGSLSEKYGKIWYEAEVNIHCPNVTTSFRRSFTVIPMVDLNQNQSLRIPSDVEKIKNYCSWFCSRSPAVIKVKLPQTGFAINEVIPITININNLKSVNVTDIHTKLIKEIGENAQTNKTSNWVERSHITSKSHVLTFEPNSQAIDICLKMTVPKIEATSLQLSILKILHYLEVVIFVSGCHKVIRLFIPITLGSIPITINSHSNARNQILNQSLLSPATLGNIVPVIPTAPLASERPDSAEEAPPPSYNEVMYGLKSGSSR